MKIVYIDSINRWYVRYIDNEMIKHLKYIHFVDDVEKYGEVYGLDLIDVGRFLNVLNKTGVAYEIITED